MGKAGLSGYLSPVRATAVSAILAFAIVAAACGGSDGDDGAEPPRPVQATAERIVENDVPTVRSTVEVRFNQALDPVSEATLAEAFTIALAEESALTGLAIGVPVVESVALSNTSSRIAVLTVDGIVADGTLLRVADDAFSEGALGETEIPIGSVYSATGVILASGMLTFGDDFATAPREIETVQESDRDPLLVREALATHLDFRGTPDDIRQAALDLYDTMPAEIAPAPKIRAALAALLGTFFQPGVESFLTDQNCTGAPAAQVIFQPPPGAPDFAGNVTFAEDGRRIVSLRPDLEAAPFELIMPVLAHEAIHCDNLDSRQEEVAAGALDIYIYLHLIAVDPELVFDPSPIARSLNIEALAMINSGRYVPESIGILQSPGVTRALPGANVDAASFDELVGERYGPPGLISPAEPVAEAYVEQLAIAAAMPEGPAFDIDYLDELLGRAISADILEAAILALGLIPL